MHIMRCSWNLRDPPVRIAELTAGEAQKIRPAIMKNFQRRIPDFIKVVLADEVHEPAIPHSKTFGTLTVHFSIMKPFLHD